MDIEFFLAILSIGLSLAIVIFSGASYVSGTNFEEETLSTPFSSAVVEVILDVEVLKDSESLDDSTAAELAILVESMREAFARDLGLDERFVYVVSVLLGSLIVTFEAVTPSVAAANNVLLSAEEALDADESLSLIHI